MDQRPRLLEGLPSTEAERATVAPDEPDAWYWLILARHRSGDHAGELAAIERILELSRDDPDARGFRAFRCLRGERSVRLRRRGG